MSPDDPVAGLGAAAPDPAVLPDPNGAPVAPGLGAAATEAPAPAPDPTASHALLGRLLAKARQTQIGRMVDRYQTPAPGTAVKRLHQDLKGLAQEGEPGRMWYEKSSKRILDYVQGNRDEAHKIAQLVAIYSPQTGVPTNTANAIKAYNRAKTGQAMWAGDILEPDKTFDTIKGASDYAQELAKQYPGGGGGNAGSSITKVPLDDSGKRFLFARHNMKGYENIATADRDLKAHLLMNHGIQFEGRKTNNFYRNLMVHIDPTIDQGSTQDLWMARAFGFHDDAVSNATKYDFMEKLTHKLGAELGWKPHQVQAAIWTAMKTRQEATKDATMKQAVDQGLAEMVQGDKGKPKFTLKPGQEDAYSSLQRENALGAVLDADHIKKSARDFSDFLDQNLAHVSWEATPSRSVDHMRGLSDLSPEKRADYHKRISEALQDSDGNDLLAKHLGMLSPGTVEAPGYWQGDVNPASHLQVAATRIKAAGQRPDIDAASRQLLDTYANARGLLLKQDGVGYHRPFYNPKVTEANGVEYQFEKPLSGEQIRTLGGLVDQIPDTALIPSGPGTMRIVNFSKMADHRIFHKAVDEALQKFDSGGITGHERLFASDGELRGNDWKANPNGEDYKTRLSAAGRPDVLRFVSDVLAPKVEAVDKAFAQEHGLKRDTRLEKAIRAAGSQEGVNLLRGLGRRPQKGGGGPVTRDKDFYDAVWRAEQALRRKKAEGGAVSDDAAPADDSADDTLYHVTLTKHLPKIQKDGIRPLQTSNWVKAGSGDRYGGGHIFAFDHPHDAEAWAAKMDWANHQKSGSGKVSIVKFKRDAGWQKDTADPLSQSSSKGSWLKKVGSVKPGQVISHQPMTTEMVRGIVQRNNRAAKAGGGSVDMGSTPYSAGEGPPGEPGQGAKKASGIASMMGSGSSGSGTPGNPANAKEFLQQLANDPKADPTTRVYAAGSLSSGAYTGSQGQEATKPSMADGGAVSDDQTPPPQPQQIGSALDTPGYIKPIDENRRTLSPIGLYSHAAEETWKQPQMKGSPAQFKAMLLKRGVKPDEFKWSGYDQAFAGKNVVTKREVRDHFVKHLPKIEETVLSNSSKHASNYDYDPDTGVTGGPKYEDYQLPGGHNYREVVLHLPPKKEARYKGSVGPFKTNADASGFLDELKARNIGTTGFNHGYFRDVVSIDGPNMSNDERAALREIAAKHGAGDVKDQTYDRDLKGYQSSHWDESNPLLHLRLSDRKGAKGEKILHLEELQSDWGQAAREKGTVSGQPLSQAEHNEVHRLAVADTRTPVQEQRLAELRGRHAASEGVPAAPYIDSTAKWTDLGLKRALHEAAKGGYDKLVVTPGEEQAKRYDLSKYIKHVDLHDNSSGGMGQPEMQGPFQHGLLMARDHQGKEVLSTRVNSPEDIARHIGKEAAEKLLNVEPYQTKYAGLGVRARSLSDQDLKVGGEGMKGFYDTILPKALEKLAKQHDPEARVRLHDQPAAAPNKNIEIRNHGDGYHWVDRRTNEPVGPVFRTIAEAGQHGHGKSTTTHLHALDITPRMRAGILAGQKGYASGGRVAERLHDDIYQKLRKTIDVSGRYP